MATTTHLLDLPYDVLRLILVRYFADLEIIVRYPGYRTNIRKLQDGATLLLVCRPIHDLAKPIFFKTVTFGHHATKLRMVKADPSSLVLAPALLPMYKSTHVCFDLEYALRFTNKFTKIAMTWPWSRMKSLQLIGYRATASGIIIPNDFLQKFRVLMKLQEKCDLRGIHFTAQLPLGPVNGVRLSLVNLLSTAIDRPVVHSVPQNTRSILQLPKMNVAPVDALSVVLIAMDTITTHQADGVIGWFQREVSFDCTFDHSSS